MIANGSRYVHNTVMHNMYVSYDVHRHFLGVGCKGAFLPTESPLLT